MSFFYVSDSLKVLKKFNPIQRDIAAIKRNTHLI